MATSRHSVLFVVVILVGVVKESAAQNDSTTTVMEMNSTTLEMSITTGLEMSITTRLEMSTTTGPVIPTNTSSIDLGSGDMTALVPENSNISTPTVFTTLTTSSVVPTTSQLVQTTSFDLLPSFTLSASPSMTGEQTSKDESGDGARALYVGLGVSAAVVVLILLLLIIVMAVIIRRSKQQKIVYFTKRSIRLSKKDVIADYDRADGHLEESKIEETNLQQLEIERSKFCKPIAIENFPHHVRQMHQDVDRGFEEEFWSLPSKPVAPYTVSKLQCNFMKNRFDNIFPYDHARVKLAEREGIEGSDYINASFQDGYNKENAYIAAQGPVRGTVRDFWKMIYEYKLFTIVMLTETVEAGKDKCELYWPTGVNESREVGYDLVVTLVEQRPYAEYKVQILTVDDTSKPDGTPITVTHYHFTAWPDHGVPVDKTCLIHFIQRVRRSHPYENSIPLLVHCSAGVGRTGTFIVLDSMLQRMKVEDSLNVYELLYQLRKKRPMMVQTSAQYVFIHDALEEFVTCGDTAISVTNIRIAINKLSKETEDKTGFLKQFELLEEVAYKATPMNCSDARMEPNGKKNRYHDRLPYNRTRVHLKATAVIGSDYINASFVDGYKQRRAYIAAQAPLESTENDFWRMLWEVQSRAIVMLCDTSEEGCHQYWPKERGVAVSYGRFKVKLIYEDVRGDYTVRKFELGEESPYVMGVPEAVVVTQFHHTKWPERAHPPSTTSILKIIDSLIKTQMTTGNHSITVMCNDGVGRTGSFICTYSQLERIKVEGVADVFQYIKAARLQRPSLVSNLEQYIFCHEILADYVNTFDNYANFKDLV